MEHFGSPSACRGDEAQLSQCSLSVVPDFVPVFAARMSGISRQATIKSTEILDTR